MTSLAAPSAPSTPPAIRAPRHHVYTRLQREWDRLSRSSSNLERARSWDLPIDGIGSLDELLEQSGYGHVGQCTEHHDLVLGALVSEAQRDELAARIVLQRLLPGLWSMVRRRRSIDGAEAAGVRDGDDDVLSTAWTVIRSFGVDRRPEFIAARMLKEIEYRTFRLPFRRRASFVPTPDEHLDRPVQVSLLSDAVQLRLVLDEAGRRGLPGNDLAVLRDWGSGEPAATIATRQQVTERTVRNHRKAALARVQALLGPDARMMPAS